MVDVIWDLEDELEGNLQHILEHDITQAEVDEVLQNPRNETGVSKSSGRQVTFGWTSTGRHIAVIWELVEDNPRSVYPVTAYEVPERRSRQRKRKR
jgi:hypothetical protein